MCKATVRTLSQATDLTGKTQTTGFFKGYGHTDSQANKQASKQTMMMMMMVMMMVMMMMVIITYARMFACWVGGWVRRLGNTTGFLTQAEECALGGRVSY